MLVISYFSIKELEKTGYNEADFGERRLKETAKYKNENARQLSICAELALIRAVGKACSEDEALKAAFRLPLEVKTGEFGKPEFADGHPLAGRLHFNVSHSGEFAVAAAADKPIGIDIECISRGYTGMAEKILNPKEAEAFRLLETEKERGYYFLENWVRKESYLKNIGIGLMIMPRDLIVNGDMVTPVDGSYPAKKTRIIRELPDEYLVSICAD